MNDVVVGLVGGLGNQMFQYAAARAVALRSGTPLRLDVSWFPTVSDRHFALAPFRIAADTLAPEPPPPPWRQLAQRLCRRLHRRCGGTRHGRPVFLEKSFHFDPDVLALRAPVRLDGYFQCEKYFADVAETIRADFRLTDPPPPQTQAVLDRIQASDAICLHIRRGDYVSNAQTNAYHGVCSLDYYRRGLEIVRDGLAQPHCFVFSDDPAWVRDNLHLDLPMTVVDIHGPDVAHEDMRLMSACRNFVTANSSFSWWGAWLGAHPEKRVVSPKQWFQGGGDTRDLIPARWVQL